MMKRNKAILCAVASFGLITAANTINANAMTMRTTTSTVQARLTVSEVEDLINKLPYTVSLKDKDDIQKASAAYESLSAEDKEFIGPYTLRNLKHAESMLTKLEGDVETAKELVKRIETLKTDVEYKYNKDKDTFTVNGLKLKDKFNEIQKIREAFENLDYSFKYGEEKKVTNYDDFFRLECKLTEVAWME